MNDSQIDENVIDTESEVDFVDESDESTSAETIKNLRAKLKQCEAEKLENLSGWQRSKADFVNARRKEIEERNSIVELSTKKLVESLTPLLESFSAALSHKDSTSAEWRAGIEQVHKQFLAILNKEGLSVIEESGVPFDPNIHEAVLTEEVKEAKLDHAVLKVLQHGYRLGARVLKPAKVVIGTHSA